MYFRSKIRLTQFASAGNGRNSHPYIDPELADEAVVEIPCQVENGKVKACPVGPLPESLVPLLSITSQVNTMAGVTIVVSSRFETNVKAITPSAMMTKPMEIIAG